MRWRALAAAAVLLLTGLVAAPPAQAAGKVPGQLVAKLYTEALGRIPDPDGWSAHLNHFAVHGCNLTTVGDAIRSFYTSTEFEQLGYSAAARVLALYRGALSREPDQAGLDDYVRRLHSGGLTWTQVVTALAASDELAALTSRICGPDASYSWGTTSAAKPPTQGTGFPGGSSADLQKALDDAPAGGTVYLAQQAVVEVDAMLTIPAGKTLATTGLPGPARYALQGRLVRAKPFDTAMIQLRSGAKLKSVWVDGQRGVPENYVLSAVNVQGMGGTGTDIVDSKLSNSLGWTNLQVFGSAEGLPCGGSRVANNLITAYSARHVDGNYTDGLSIACERSVVENNSIVDPTDVGIVLFRSSPAVQTSVVRGNQVLAAGNSAYGALGIDPLFDKGATQDFTGSSVTGNRFWTGPGTHFDFGLAIGTRPWFGNRADLGLGASVTGNTTNGLTAAVNTGIGVSGMNRAVVQGNDLRLALGRYNACPNVNFGLDADGFAEDGDFQPGGVRVSFVSPAGANCLGH